MRPSEHSVPPTQTFGFRRLGVGPTNTNSHSIIRIAAAAFVAIILVAIPLYFWRKPSSEVPQGAASAATSVTVVRPSVDPSVSMLSSALENGVETERVTLGRVWIDSCKRANSRPRADQCDRQPFFEEALVKAILNHPTCAPKTNKQASISYAVRVDYRKKTVRVFAGKSGTLKKEQAKQSVECIQRALPRPSWETMSHQYSNYVIAVLATFPPTE